MSANSLIHWMAHVGHGSWASFKRAAAITLSQRDASLEPRSLRLRFSDLGVAEFFVDGTERWRAFQPLLVRSPHQPREGFLCGARTPALVKRLRRAAEQHGCFFAELLVDGAFTNVKVVGDALHAVARTAEVAFEADIGRRLAADLI